MRLKSADKKKCFWKNFKVQNYVLYGWRNKSVNVANKHAGIVFSMYSMNLVNLRFRWGEAANYTINFEVQIVMKRIMK